MPICLQFTVNKLMQLILFCLLLLFPLAISQAQTIQPQFGKGNQSINIEQKVMEYLIQSYPQLANCTLVKKSTPTRSQHAKELDLVYHHFIFENIPNTYLVLVTLSLSSPNQFVSISPLVVIAEGNDSFTPAKADSPKKHILSNSWNTILKRKDLGGYQTFTEATDSRLDTAEAFVDSLHPYMIDYWKEFIQYEIVSGVNFIIEYIGIDSITAATAGININLNFQPQLLTFEIHCQLQNVSSLAIPCTDDLALKIFNANQMLMVIHPQLLSYKLVSMVSDDTYSPDGIMFIITFEDKESSTRIMAEVNIQDTHLTILAYYIYQYPSNET